MAIAPFLLGSCTELMGSPTDIIQLRSDLQANTQMLSQLAARVEALERRQTATEITSRQMQQELSQAIFWQYSQISNQKYVVFEKASGQVSGWRGL